MSATTDMSSNNSSVSGKSQVICNHLFLSIETWKVGHNCNTHNYEHQQKLSPAKVAGTEAEDNKLNMVTSDIKKDNDSMKTEFHQCVAQGANQTVSNQLGRTSATAGTLSTPVENEQIKLTDTTQTSTSSQCDQNQPNISIVSKIKETRPQDNAEPDFVSLRIGRYTGNSAGEKKVKNAFNRKEHDILHKNLALGLEFRADAFYSENNSNLNSKSYLIGKEKGDDSKKEEENRSLKTPRSGEDDKIAHNPPKKAKVDAVKMPCNTSVEHQQNLCPDRTSATAVTVSIPGGNEDIILPDTRQTSTSPRCDHNLSNVSIASKVTEMRPQENAESDFVSLRLGRYTGNSSGEEMGKKAINHKEHDTLHNNLALGLEFRVDTSYSELNTNLNSRSDLIRIEKGEDPETEEENRSLKAPRSEEDVKCSQNPPKKAKIVTIRMPCNTKVIGDGCQWKKYGQKAAKGSPFPRSYYHCCVTSTCEAKKQVQICPEDLSTLITTYEGVHSHPLPVISTNVASDPAAAIPMSRCASTGSLTQHSSPQSSQTTRGSQTHSIPSSSKIPPGTPVVRKSLTSQPSGFPSSSLPPSARPPALSVTLTKMQFPSVQFGRASPNFIGSPIFPPTRTTAPNFPASPLFSPTSPATAGSQLNPAAIYSKTSPYIFSVGSSSGQTNISQVNLSSGSSTNRASFSNNGHVGTSHVGGLPSPRHQHQHQHQLNSYNKNQCLMETLGPGRQQKQGPTSQPPTNNSRISAQQMMDDKVAAATTLITSHPAFQSQIAAVVSSLVSNKSSVGLPQSHGQGVNYSHLPLPSQLLYMPSGLGPLNMSPSPLNSQPENSISTPPFPYHVAEAPLFPTSQSRDHSK